jgi:hypothetical protein
MGVASRSCGGAGRPDGRMSGGMSDRWVGLASEPLTGFMFGEGGMPRVRRGAREPLWLRAPGTGGLRSGAGDDMMGTKPKSAELESLGFATLTGLFCFFLLFSFVVISII